MTEELIELGVGTITLKELELDFTKWRRDKLWCYLHFLNRTFPVFILLIRGASLVAQMVKILSAMQETWDHSLVWEDSLEKRIAIHSSIPA